MVYKTTKLINKKIYFNGLSPIGAMVSVVVIILAFLIFSWIGLVITGFPVLFISGKIAKETKKGNPGFLNSFLRFQNIKTVYIDNSKVLTMIR